LDLDPAVQNKGVRGFYFGPLIADRAARTKRAKETGAGGGMVTGRAAPAGLGLGSTLPTERAARGGGHAGVRVFQALRRPKRYGIRCNMTREERGSSPRAWIGRGGAEGGRPRQRAAGTAGAREGGRRGVPWVPWYREQLRTWL
jgi:hypothetical protein